MVCQVFLPVLSATSLETNSDFKNISFPLQSVFFWSIKLFALLKVHKKHGIGHRIRNYWIESLREKCPYLELFWSVFPRIRTEYREILHISLYSVRMWENTDQSNSEYSHFLRSEYHGVWFGTYFHILVITIFYSASIILNSRQNKQAVMPLLHMNFLSILRYIFLYY